MSAMLLAAAIQMAVLTNQYQAPVISGEHIWTCVYQTPTERITLYSIAACPKAIRVEAA